MRFLLVLAVLGGCVCEGDHLVDDAYAPKVPYAAYIDQCITKRDCDPLCLALFELGPDQNLVSCHVEHVDAQGTALVEMRSVDTSVCAADPGEDSGWVDTSGDDGSTTDGTDDGSANDGSTSDGTDDGSTSDGTDDGSTDDGSTGDGGTGDGGTGDGGTDDGSYRRGSTPIHAPATRALVSQNRV